MAIVATDIARRVKRLFGDESGVQVTDADIIDWINDATREVYIQSDNLKQFVSTIPTVAGTSVYDLPTNVLALQTVRYAQDGSSYYDLGSVSPKAMSEYMDGWDGSDGLSGRPYFFSRGDSAGTFSVYPIPEAVGTLKLVYSRTPVAITTVNDSLDIPDRYFSVVLEYCLMKAYEMDENYEAMAMKVQYIQSTINEHNAREAWFAQQTYPSIVPTSEDYL